LLVSRRSAEITPVVIWRYGIVEFHFAQSGGLSLVFSEQPDFVAGRFSN
jgi:hypothetical protein